MARRVTSGRGSRVQPSAPKPKRTAKGGAKSTKADKSAPKEWVTIRWYVPPENPPINTELAARFAGLQTRRQQVSEPNESGIRVAQMDVTRGQKPWAEELLFVLQGATPAMADDDLEPATVRRMKTKSPYKLRRTFSKRRRRPGGIKGWAIDLIDRITDPGRGERIRKGVVDEQ